MSRRVNAITRVTAVIIIVIIIVAAAGGFLYWYTTTGPAAPRKVKIAVVSDIGGRGDLSFNDMAFKGGEEAEKEFGIGMVELVSKVEADYVPNLEMGAKDPDVKLIVGVGFLLSDALVEVALKYPDKNFAGIDTYSQDIVKEKYPDKYPLPNLMDIKFEEHKGSALVGAVGCLLAAYYNEAGGQYPYIGGVFGIEIPVLWKFEIGYKWGCDWALKWYEKKFGRKAPIIGEDTRYGSGAGWKDGMYCPPETPGQCWYKGRVLWTYTGTFSDITKGYEAAKPMYAKGAIAVYNIAGPLGLGINQAVKEIAEARGLTMGPPFWIGVDADQDWINPGFVIVSMMKRVDKGVYYATKLVLEGKFREVVKQYNGVLTLGIGTQVLGTPMEGISASTLKDLDEFIQMGVEAEKLTGKKVLPMSPEEIKAKAESMHKSVAPWIWDALAELEEKIKKGEVEVPLAFTKDAIDYWRGILG
jgi:basic membrane protein A